MCQAVVQGGEHSGRQPALGYSRARGGTNEEQGFPKVENAATLGEGPYRGTQHTWPSLRGQEWLP